MRSLRRVNQGWVYRDRVEAGVEGWTVLDYYEQRYRHSSRLEWQARIDSGQIRLDGRETTPETPLRRGQCLSYHRPPWEEAAVPLRFAIAYGDRDLLVVAKPAGLPVLPGGGFLEHTLLHLLQQEYPEATPLPIHRLGRGTSGLVLLARSPLARSVLSQQMRDRQIQKTYRALVSGTGMPDQFSVTQAIGKLNHPVLGHLYAATPEGLPARSDCRVLRREAETALLEVKILTGRPHQIRIHLAAAGYPLVGDRLYGIGGLPLTCLPGVDGTLPVPGDCGYHLHALKLAFNHPTAGNRLHLSWPAPPPLAIAADPLSPDSRVEAPACSHELLGKAIGGCN